MDVLITGATGFIGARLALACLAAGDSVRALGRENNEVEAANGRALADAGAELRIGSVTDAAFVDAACEGVEVVHHLAAAQHEANLPDAYFHEVNVEGTRQLLEASEHAGVGRFVHGSTIGVFAAQSGRTSELSPLEPDNVYGRTKLLGEQVVQSFAGKLPTVIVRVSETYGPGDRRLLKLFRGVRRGLGLMIGPGANLHHPIYVDDLVRALRRAATVPEAVGASCVVAGPRALSTREMLDAVARAVDESARNIRIPLMPLMALAYVSEGLFRPLGMQPPLHRRRMDFFRKSFAFSLVPAREQLGFEPEVGFEDGARETAAWYREQGLL